uniref:Gcn5-related n-acetyltransferase n=1 Tax=Colletotrichum fructicola (strain Nara gc5) TaxID=1213859 RepID=L2G063_COLFN
MGTPFVSLLEPTRLDAYIRGRAHDEQPAAIPKLFCDAMEVREEVFVKEQAVPAENEFDADDSRACHWVSYASVSKVVEQEVLDADGNIVKPRRSSTRATPIGTIRLVPFPHDPHPKDGGVYWDGKLEEIKVGAGGGSEAVETATEEMKSPVKEDGVPYVKLGRLAVIEGFRGHRISLLLVNTVLAWLKEKPSYFDPSIKEMGLEQIGASTAEEVPKWKGLVCVHAQKQVVEMWEKMGFTVDEGMGTWWEEGIEHKGMFMRLDVQPETTPLV